MRPKICITKACSISHTIPITHYIIVCYKVAIVKTEFFITKNSITTTDKSINTFTSTYCIKIL